MYGNDRISRMKNEEHNVIIDSESNDCVQESGGCMMNRKTGVIKMVKRRGKSNNDDGEEKREG